MIITNVLVMCKELKAFDINNNNISINSSARRKRCFLSLYISVDKLSIKNEILEIDFKNKNT